VALLEALGRGLPALSTSARTAPRERMIGVVTALTSMVDPIG
jgi:hypothetical protein